MRHCKVLIVTWNLNTYFACLSFGIHCLKSRWHSLWPIIQQHDLRTEMVSHLTNICWLWCLNSCKRSTITRALDWSVNSRLGVFNRLMIITSNCWETWKMWISWVGHVSFMIVGGRCVDAHWCLSGSSVDLSQWFFDDIVYDLTTGYLLRVEP